MILTANDVAQRRTVSTTRSYLSQVELPLTFGLGSSEKVDKLSIVWPDGSSQTVTNIPINQLTAIEQE